MRRNDDAVADQAARAIGEHSGRNDVQDGLLAAHHEGVAGIVPALETHHGIGVVGEQIDDLALALVAPLGAENHDGSRHWLS